MNLILGAGLAGLSCSYHLGHERCLVLEAKPHAFGHVHSLLVDGFTWDEGPHVSFTRHDYVRDLFAASVGGEYLEREVVLSNYWKGHWIEHPAQFHLHSVPEPLRTRCVESFLAIPAEAPPPRHYGEWLDQAFGKVFADEFSRRYTRKYWTVEAEELGTDWVGPRVQRPLREQVLAGAVGPTGTKHYYIQQFRYPKRGGYQQFVSELARGARIELNCKVARIDLVAKKVFTSDGRCFDYRRLINTLPLPEFVAMTEHLPVNARESAKLLRCSQLLLVNVAARQNTPSPNPWVYVYDEEKLSTRINFTELLSPNNAPEGWTGIQVEVYRRESVTGAMTDEQICDRVVHELREMQLLEPSVEVCVHSSPIAWANVIFTRDTSEHLEQVWQALEPHGLSRDADDTHPLTEWDLANHSRDGNLVMAGRFGQWKYYWTDDCVLRGRSLAR